MTASCPGFATYQNLPNGQVQVNGTLPVFTSSVRIDPLLVAWDKYGSAIVHASREFDVPVPWLVGIMMAESKGNARACSPCSICRSELCASGAGMRCCAFGLMQFIEPTAQSYGVTPTQLVDNPALSLLVAAELVSDLSEKVGYDLVRISAAYNGGLNSCGKAGTTFGWYTNGDYPMVVAQYANTFVNLGLPVPGDRSSIAAAFFATVGVGLAAAIYTGRL